MAVFDIRVKSFPYERMHRGEIEGFQSNVRVRVRALCGQMSESRMLLVYFVVLFFGAGRAARAGGGAGGRREGGRGQGGPPIHTTYELTPRSSLRRADPALNCAPAWLLLLACCALGARLLRTCCAPAWLLLGWAARPYPEMSVSHHRCRKNEAQRLTHGAS
jgi:hypothetical protein